MTASPGREVDANLLRPAALGSAQPRAEPQDAGGQDLGDLVEALGGRHKVGVERVGQSRSALGLCCTTIYTISDVRVFSRSNV
jgi:hypothetical protein